MIRPFTFQEAFSIIKPLHGHIIPLSLKDVLANLSIKPYTDHEWDNLPHVILTSELEWAPSVLDHTIKENEQWGDVSDIDTPFDEMGDYKHRAFVNICRISRDKMVITLNLFSVILLISVSLTHKHQLLLQKLSFMMHTTLNRIYSLPLPYQKTHLLISPRSLLNMTVTISNYVPSLAG
jgi:hypothetical protein